MTLQEEFMKTRDAAVRIKGKLVIQMDTIPVRDGIVTIQFVSSNSRLTGGVALEAPKGYIVHSDNQKAKLLYTWNEQGLPNHTTHKVHCPGGQLRIWNIYRIHHDSGLVTEDAFTGNAGMVVTRKGEYKRLYECSDSMGDFDTSNLVFELGWRKSEERKAPARKHK